MNLFRSVLLALALCLAFAASARADALLERDAQQLLHAAHAKRFEPGSYRIVATTTAKSGAVTTTTTLVRYDEKGAKFSRTEAVTTRRKRPEKTRTRITIQNDEGVWKVYGRSALLMPTLIDREAILEIARQAAASKPSGVPPENWGAKLDPELRHFFQQGYELSQHMHFSGETFEQEGHPFARVVRSLDEQGVKVMRQMAEEQMAKAKKELPWGLRMLASVMLATKDFGELMPVREEFLIDREKTRVLETKTFNGQGKLLRSYAPDTLERIPDLPPETFVIPQDYERFRPPTLGKAIELMNKLEKEERAGSKDPTPEA